MCANHLFWADFHISTFCLKFTTFFSKSQTWPLNFVVSLEELMFLFPSVSRPESSQFTKRSSLADAWTSLFDVIGDDASLLSSLMVSSSLLAKR